MIVAFAVVQLEGGQMQPNAISLLFFIHFTVFDGGAIIA